MRASKISSYVSSKETNPEKWARDVNSDLDNIFLVLSGRVRFGPNNNVINMGDNIQGQFLTYTTNATPNTEDTIPHNLGSIPIGYIVVKQNKAGSIYDSGTAWNLNNLYLKSNTASILVTLFLMQ